MFVQRLKIENWKNFRKGDVNLSRRLFLIGPNASGKSNFLDIFRFLREISLDTGGGFKQAVETRNGVSAIRCLFARKKPDISIEVELKDDDDSVWVYQLSFGQNQNRNPIIKSERVEHNGKVLLSRPDDDDKKDIARLSQTSLEQLNANNKFRSIANFFQSINYQHLIPQVVRDSKGFSPVSIINDPFGRDFLHRVERTRTNIRDSRLKKIESVLQIAVPQLKELKVSRDNSGIPHLEGIFEHWRPHGAKQFESQFSDGTLRLFGLLWSLFEGDGTLLMEEPELSLHKEVVRQLPAMIEKINRSRKPRRQVIISTFSEEMLDNQGIGGEEVIRLEPSPDGTKLVSPLDSEEEMEQLKNGLTIADVVLPKSSPKDIQGLLFSL
ncbi:MAG: AAA family ATPase [Pyrinomonadaceae bacterium]